MLVKGSSLFNKSSSFENCMTNKSVSATARQYQIEAGWENVILKKIILNFMAYQYVQYIDKIKRGTNLRFLFIF